MLRRFLNLLEDSRDWRAAREIETQLWTLSEGLRTQRGNNWTEGDDLSSPAARGHALEVALGSKLPAWVIKHLDGSGSVDVNRMAYAMPFSLLHLALPPALQKFIEYGNPVLS